MPCELIIKTLTDVGCKLLFEFVSILFYDLGYLLQIFGVEAVILGQFYVWL